MNQTTPSSVVRRLQELGHAALSGDLLEVDAGAPGETLGSLCLFLPAGILLLLGFLDTFLLFLHIYLLKLVSVAGLEPA